MMNDNHKLGLYVSYYLARFDKIAYKNLNFGNQEETHREVGRILSINSNTVKNWRDEFDPLFGHRVGWYQRPLSPTRVQVYNALNDLSESEVRLVIKRILENENTTDLEVQSLSRLIDEKSDDKKKKFILRTPTGKKAEQFFIDYFQNHKLPHNGELTDTRDLGCGYGFEILKYYIEVKGLSNNEGGILLTNKEWEMSKEKGDRYYIVLVSNITGHPKISFIRNPYLKLNPKESIVKTIQINWSVSAQTINELVND